MELTIIILAIGLAAWWYVQGQRAERQRKLENLELDKSDDRYSHRFTVHVPTMGWSTSSMSWTTGCLTSSNTN